MSLWHFFWTAMLSMLPIAELRGGIPYAILRGDIPYYIAYFYCVFFNFLVAPFGYLFLKHFNHFVCKHVGFYRRFFEKVSTKAELKIRPKVEKYGFWGVMIFVAIPLPITGAYTGTLGAWLLGVSWKKTCLAVLCGVIISGIIVTSIVVSGSEAFSFLIKDVDKL
ncbi:MAG: small multi-drug export protein [Spirochaetales bacterium]|nr:small multi-drug export protein [Spirochaetales bacterium]